jgi:hypothetical protein
VYSLCRYGAVDVNGSGVPTSAATPGAPDIQRPVEFAVRDRFPAGTGFAPYAKPGHFNDPDGLRLNGGTDTEYRTHMSLWSSRLR